MSVGRVCSVCLREFEGREFWKVGISLEVIGEIIWNFENVLESISFRGVKILRIREYFL